MYDRKEKNYRLFCYFNSRRLNNGRTVISIKTLEQYCEVPNYTIQHLVSLRRLMTDEKLNIVISVMTEEFGFDLDRSLSKEELENRYALELFN